MVGNFPQAFSHIALVSAAFFLETGKRLRKRSERNHRPGAISPPRRSVSKTNRS
jgi:hypothetical protein